MSIQTGLLVANFVKKEKKRYCGDTVLQDATLVPDITIHLTFFPLFSCIFYLFQVAKIYFLP